MKSLNADPNGIGREFPIRQVSADGASCIVDSALGVVARETGPAVSLDREQAVIAAHDTDPEVSTPYTEPDLIDRFGGTSYAS